MTTLYLDMDGVVADWVTGAARIIGYALPNPNAMYPNSDWQRIRDDQRLYRHLPEIDASGELITVARQFRDDLDYDLAFLTAIPHGNDMPWAFQDKVYWAGERWSDIPVFFGPYSRDKQVHCRPGDILVDDREDNCSRWVSAGGRAILVSPSGQIRQAIADLRGILDKEREARAAERSPAKS